MRPIHAGASLPNTLSSGISPLGGYVSKVVGRTCRRRAAGAALFVVAIVALAVPGTALGDTTTTVPTPVGTLNLDIDPAGSIASTGFTFGGQVLPIDAELASLNGDNVNNWISGQTEMDFVALYPGFVQYREYGCVRITFAVQDPLVTDPPVVADTGWHCNEADNWFTVDSITATAAQYPANGTVAFGGGGNDNRLPYVPGAVFPAPDLSQYAGAVLVGTVYSNACADIYLDVDYYPPGGEGGVNNMTGCIGSQDPFTTGVLRSSRHLAAAIVRPTGPTTAIRVRVPGGCVVPRGLRGRTVKAARVALANADCRLGHVHRVHSSLHYGRVIRPRLKAGSVHRVHTPVPLLVSRGRR